MTMPHPLVSIIVPAFNAAAHLEPAVRSALSQTLREVEVLVVDDASTDGTAGLARRLAAEDPRLRLIQSPRNLGPAGARNLGLDAARGEWVALLDADDAFAPDRLSRLLAAARDRRADMVADNLLLDGPEPGRLAPMLPPVLLPEPRLVDAATFLEGNLPVRGHPRVSFGFLKPLFRLAFLREHGLAYDQEMRFAEDFLFYTRALMAGGRFWLLPDALYHYQVREDSLTASHGAEELARLFAATRRLRRDAAARADRRLRLALDRHAASIERRLAWRLFTDRVKQGRPLAALTAASTPRRAWHIARECSLALPKFAGRLIGGGQAGTGVTG